MFNLYDSVKLKNDDNECGIKSSYDGVIVDILAGGAAYVVEFFDNNGETIEASLFTEYSPDQLLLLSRGK